MIVFLTLCQWRNSVSDKGVDMGQFCKVNNLLRPKASKMSMAILLLKHVDDRWVPIGDINDVKNVSRYVREVHRTLAKFVVRAGNLNFMDRWNYLQSISNVFFRMHPKGIFYACSHVALQLKSIEVGKYLQPKMEPNPFSNTRGRQGTPALLGGTARDLLQHPDVPHEDTGFPLAVPARRSRAVRSHLRACRGSPYRVRSRHHKVPQRVDRKPFPRYPLQRTAKPHPARLQDCTRCQLSCPLRSRHQNTLQRGVYQVLLLPRTRRSRHGKEAYHRRTPHSSFACGESGGSCEEENSSTPRTSLTASYYGFTSSRQSTTGNFSSRSISPTSSTSAYESTKTPPSTNTYRKPATLTETDSLKCAFRVLTRS